MNRKTLIKLVIWTVIILIVAGTTVRLIRRFSEASSEVVEQSTTVDVGVVSRGTLESLIDTEGTIWATNAGSLYSENDYKVKEVFIEIGDHINSGDLVLTIDTKPLFMQIDNLNLQLIQ